MISIKSILKEYKNSFRDKNFICSYFFALALLIISLIVNYYAGSYSIKVASNHVTDIILSNIRSYDVDFFFIWGGIAMCIFIALICLQNPKQMPFIVKTIALFVLIRSVFITLTHLGPYPTAIDVQSVIIQRFSFGGDLFFSGHTGLPFLWALIFWKSKILRYFFIGLSIFFGLIVLMGHLHYSIDVFSAFFITYAIFHLARYLFKKDHYFFTSTLNDMN